jgi:glycosyltransferase involved in cell wall biosynthesis
MNNLLLIPLSYPYDIGAEKTFLENEVSYYSRVFDNIVILPSKESENQDELGDEITLDNSLAKFDQSLAQKKMFALVFFKNIFMLIFEIFKNVKHTTRSRGLKKTLGYYWQVCRYIIFFEAYFSNKENEKWVIYTYWFTPITTAAAIFASKKINFAIITRAHGIDLYEFRNNNYIPFRPFTIRLLDRFFFVSEHGRQYASLKYPQFKDKYIVAPIGIADHNVKTAPSGIGKLRIVSCSRVDENKRVHLIYKGLKMLKERLPELDIAWDHFGDGPMYNELAVIQQKEIGLAIRLHGQVENECVFNFYQNNEIDVFMLTSTSEGGRPVSITEALCCSIPVIATDVGGIPDLINDGNGILLSKNPSAEEISNSLRWFAENKESAYSKRIQARETWEKNCAAENVCYDFMNELSKLLP